MDGSNTIVSFWDGLFSGAMLVSGMVSIFLQKALVANDLTVNPWEV